MSDGRGQHWPSPDDEHAVEQLAAAIHGDDCTCPFTPIEPDWLMARAILDTLAKAAE